MMGTTERLLEGKTILVTGTARGMGHKMVEVFAANGANVIAHARKDSEEHRNFCREVSERDGVQIIPLYFELRNSDEIKDGIKEIRSTKLPVNGLVNNAGITYNALFQMTKIEELRNQFEVNFFAPFILAQYIVKLMMRSGGGSIVNVSSTAALDGNSGKSAYGSSKAALIAMTKSISEEMAPSGIRANVICPGITETDMIEHMHGYVFDMQKEDTFLKKVGETADVANMALFLLSDYSSYITGQVLRVDGGITQYSKRKEGED